MSRIKLRVWGLHDDVQVIANWFADMANTVSVSNLYANRPPSKKCRCYIYRIGYRIPCRKTASKKEDCK